MKRLLAAGLACALLALALSGCARSESRAAVLSCDAGAPAAAVLADAAQGAVLARADSDRAALEQLSQGNCQFAVVREHSLREALTGGDAYYGQALDNLVRLDNLLLGAFCVFSLAGEIDNWQKDGLVLVLKDGGAGEALAGQLTDALGLTNTRDCTREEALQMLKKGNVQAVMGLMLPEERLVKELCRLKGSVVLPGVELEAPAEERSMTRALLPVLYDGMPYGETFCLYGALVTAKQVDEKTQQSFLHAASGMQAHLHNLPRLPVDEE